ncbi:MAG TPA: helix-turn-helix transcriptional regulator [Acidimicrobiia bacterium]
MSTAPMLIREGRHRAGITQAELARRAQLPRSAINAYERGTRDPGSRTLDRILRAMGCQLTLAPTVRVLDDERASRILGDVLELAEALPRRRRGQLRYPRLPAA